MIETATELSQKFTTKLSALRKKQKGVECHKRKLNNQKKLNRRSSTSYEKAKIDCLATKQPAKEKMKWNVRNTNYNNLTAVMMELTVKDALTNPKEYE